MKLTVCIPTIILFGAVNAIFDCRRDQQGSCKNGATCDTSNGDCTGCPATHEGYDCSVPLADTGGPVCLAYCLNGGTCHLSPASTLYCLCTEDYTGDKCSDKRYEVDCSTADEMSLTIRPHVDTFSGTIYLEGKPGVAACQLTQTGGTGPYQLNGLSNTHATCGNAGDDGSGGKTRQFLVRFIPNTVNVQDELVNFTCTSRGTVDKAVAAVTVTNVQTNIQTTEEDNGPVDADIDFTLEKSDGSPGTGNQNLGTKLTVKANLTSLGSAKFEAVRLQQCTAASHVDVATGAADYQSNLFIDSYCKSTELVNTMVGDISRTSTAVSFDFNVFKFDNTGDVYISCTIEACVTASDCAAASCTDGSSVVTGRKKREAGSVQKNMTRSYTITDPFSTAAAKAAKEEAKACYQTWQMTATVVALAVALLLVLFLCLILIIKAILNRRSRTTYREDVSVTNSSDHLPHLPTIICKKT